MESRRGRFGGRGRGDRGGGRGDRGRGDRGRGGRGGGGRGDRGRGGGGRGDRGRGGGGQHFGWMTVREGELKVKNFLSPLLLEVSSVKKFKDLAEGRFAPRPDDGGTAGKPFNVRTNFFQLQCKAPSVFQYDVEVREHGRILQGEAEEGSELVVILPVKLNRAVIQKCASDHSWPDNWAFDGQRILYAPKKLMDANTKIFLVDVSTDGREKMFDVKIALAATLKSDDVKRYLQQSNIAIPYSLITAVEVCLKSSFVNDPSYVCYGRSVFPTEQTNKHDLPGGAELWKGHFQSVRLTQNGLILNLDITYNAFIKEQSVMDVILSTTHLRNPVELKKLDARGWRQIGRELSGLLITTTHIKSSKKHKCSGFTKLPADSLTFTKKDGAKESVAEYWKGKYGKLHFPWMPCVDASKGKKKLNYIPIEVCRLAPGQRKGKPTPDQMRDIISGAARKPADRFKDIKTAATESNFRNNTLLQAFKIEIQNKEIEASARLLPQPHLQYAQPECLDTGDRGAWNLQDVKLYKGGTLTSWSVVSIARNTNLLKGHNGLENFITELKKMMRKMGLHIPEPDPPIIDGSRMDTKSALAEGARKAQATFNAPAQLVMVMLPTKDSYTYGEVKRVAEGELGLMTQCFVTTSAGIGGYSKGQMQYLANLTIKINLKIGGKNCKLVGSLSHLFPVLGAKNKRPFIVFGADVTHPRTRDTSEPSVAAVVASMDSELSEFCTRTVFLPHRQEMLDMKQAIKELLICFRQKNKVTPEAVFYYRDGVSDGQFESVLHHEYEQFQEAFKLLNPEYKPPVTFIVVKKRHHLRLLPSGQLADRNGNAKPGTVIDSGITSKYDFDFYLNSHAGIQGTNKCAHYYCLLDENGFGSDGLQLFTYWFCYLYGRCTRSVSYAPPTYYAHHAATHGKHLTGFDSDISSMEGGRAEQTIGIHAALKDKMYFV